MCTEDISADKFFEVDFANSIEYKCSGKDEIVNVWKRIWEDEEENKIQRRYDIDCEEYKKMDQLLYIFLGFMKRVSSCLDFEIKID